MPALRFSVGVLYLLSMFCISLQIPTQTYKGVNMGDYFVLIVVIYGCVLATKRIMKELDKIENDIKGK